MYTVRRIARLFPYEFPLPFLFVQSGDPPALLGALPDKSSDLLLNRLVVQTCVS
jgi:hypothetical protein